MENSDAQPRPVRSPQIAMWILLATLGCVLGVALESWKWPQDRRAAMEKYVASEGMWESFTRGLGLALGHSLVRWLIAFAVSGWVVAAVLGSPVVLPLVKSAIDAHRISAWLVDLFTGLAICVLMAALALAARRFAG